MEALIVVVVIVAVLLLIVLALAVRIVTQYEQDDADPVAGDHHLRQRRKILDATTVFPAPLMSTIEECGSFLARGRAAARGRDDGSPAPALPSREVR